MNFPPLEHKPKNKKYTECPYCGVEGLHYWHHVYYGSNKKHSECYGAVIYPCEACHKGRTDSIHLEKSQEKNYELKRYYQQLIMDSGVSMEEWLATIGKNYL